LKKLISCDFTNSFFGVDKIQIYFVTIPMVTGGDEGIPYQW